jgi:hypothetical protein
MQVGDKVQDQDGRYGEVTLIAIDTAGSWLDPGEPIVFVLDSSNGIERFYSPDELEPADPEGWDYAQYQRQRAQG